MTALPYTLRMTLTAFALSGAIVGYVIARIESAVKQHTKGTK